MRTLIKIVLAVAFFAVIASPWSIRGKPTLPDDRAASAQPREGEIPSSFNFRHPLLW